jgi:GNAT superfamily N-acetyltransferase
MVELGRAGPATVAAMDTGRTDTPDAPRLWRLYGEHAAALFASGPRPARFTDQRWFFVASGAGHVDMNQAALFGAANAGDAESLASRVARADVPCLLGCSQGVLSRVAPTLRSAGFVPLPAQEALFWRAGPPAEPGPAPFRVRRIRTGPDIAAMQAIFLEAHGYAPALIDQLYGSRVQEDDGLSAWVAWEGDEAVSFAIVIEVGASLSLWEVQTPVRHRRRGAGRAVVDAALSGAAAAAAHPIEEVLFWASPAGRPLYDAMGFMVGDLVDAWTLGASPEDLAAVGA